MTPTPVTLRITDSRQGRAEAPALGDRAFQMTTLEARAAPDVAGMRFPFSVLLFVHDYIVMVLHHYRYEYFIFVRLACDRVICHLHTLDI